MMCLYLMSTVLAAILMTKFAINFNGGTILKGDIFFIIIATICSPVGILFPIYAYLKDNIDWNKPVWSKKK